MDDQVLIKTLLAQDEGPTLDFKSMAIRLGEDYHKAKVVKNIISMSNTPRQGSAYIISGVVRKPDGTKDVVGVAEHIDDSNLQTLLSSKVHPIPKFHYRSVLYNGKSLGILEVFPQKGGPFRPNMEYGDVLRRGVIYFRRGSSNAEAEAEDIREIVKWMTDETKEEDLTQKLIKRPASLPIGGVSLALPCFFPSISSVKANLKPVEFLRVLRGVDHPLFLISAYDLHNSKGKREQKQMRALLEQASAEQKAIILDSGTYESFWHKDASWKLKDFWQSLASYRYGFAFHFDRREQNTSKNNPKILINDIERAVLRDQEKAFNGTIVPIVHGPANILPETVRGVVDRLAPVMTAIPERELGEGIIGRAKTIARIRRLLAETGVYYPIHLLGTGNPLSILIYVLSGADSFDGLEWCQTAVNHESALLYHFQQRELFAPKPEFSTLSTIPYAQVTLAHNLLFYRKWMKEIQDALESASLLEFADKHLTKTFLDNLNEHLKESN